ncbi:hypothetical protein SS50377_28503 [Spironucleus salmonicida]|uniref:Uncharacterized protein n=1 Tax=Spironucleus salmonicida TaxID=348837 RepID=A0A9P8LJK4_9EUKA|nr:hypothetical protein SS50377_28503 [Spironucleus salmonicida]
MQQKRKHNILTRTGAALRWSCTICLCTICSALSIRRTIEYTILGSPSFHQNVYYVRLCACGVRDSVQKGPGGPSAQAANQYFLPSTISLSSAYHPRSSFVRYVHGTHFSDPTRVTGRYDRPSMVLQCLTACGWSSVSN